MPACERCQLVASPACPAPMIATSTPCFTGATLADLLDEVSLCRLDLDSARLEVSNPAVQLFGLATDLEQHPALVTGHVRAPDVGDQLELLAELIDHRLLDHRRPEDQLEPPPPHSAESKLEPSLRPPPARWKSRPWRRLGR